MIIAVTPPQSHGWHVRMRGYACVSLQTGRRLYAYLMLAIVYNADGTPDIQE